jgi:hypothetical protein
VADETAAAATRTGPDADEVRGWIVTAWTCSAELELLENHGIRGDAGRAADLDARGFDAVSASPAN